MLPVAGTFVLVMAIVIGMYWAFVLRLEDREHGAVTKRLVVRSGGGHEERLGVLRDIERLSTIGFLDTALSRAGIVTRPLQRVIALSGVRLTVGSVVLMSICASLACYVIAVNVSPYLIVALVVPIVVLLTPYLVLYVMAMLRLRQFEEQFPEAIDIIGRTLRAGHAFTTGLKLVAEELPQPVSTEFKVLYDRQSFGMPLDDALKAFAERVPVVDARFFVTAVLTQREAGGNLAEVLDNLSHVIRERFKVKRQVRAVSAHGRLTGLILASMPVVMAFAMLYNSPSHFNKMLANPLGVRMAIGAVVLQIVGAVVIRRVTNVRY
jgi:tight adherence protein B